MSDIAKHVSDRRAQVAHHNRLYYQEARLEITDQAYDRLLRELAAWEITCPDFADDESPTQKVGDDRTEHHARRMTNKLHVQNTAPVEDLLELLVRRIDLIARINDDALRVEIQVTLSDWLDMQYLVQVTACTDGHAFVAKSASSLGDAILGVWHAIPDAVKRYQYKDVEVLKP